MPTNGKKGVDNNCIIRRVSLDEFLTKNGERRGIDWRWSKKYLQDHGIEETQERLERVAQNAEQYYEQYCHEGWSVQYRLTQEGGDNCNSFIDKCCKTQLWKKLAKDTAKPLVFIDGHFGILYNRGGENRIYIWQPGKDAVDRPVKEQEDIHEKDTDALIKDAAKWLREFTGKELDALHIQTAIASRMDGNWRRDPCCEFARYLQKGYGKSDSEEAILRSHSAGRGGIEEGNEKELSRIFVFICCGASWEDIDERRQAGPNLT